MEKYIHEYGTISEEELMYDKMELKCNKLLRVLSDSPIDEIKDNYSRLMNQIKNKVFVYSKDIDLEIVSSKNLFDPQKFNFTNKLDLVRFLIQQDLILTNRNLHIQIFNESFESYIIRLVGDTMF